MGTTSPDALPYPEPNAPVLVHVDVKALAEKTQTAISADRVSRGVRVAQSSAQPISAAGLYAVTQWAAPASGTDPDGFWSSASVFEPIIIPAGLGGEYLIQLDYEQNAIATTRGYVDLRINGNFGGRAVFLGDNKISPLLYRRLNAGDKLKMEVYTSATGATIAAGCSIDIRQIKR